MHPIITDNATLGTILNVLPQAPFVVMDTEFLRESTYYPQLCLIQIATPDGLWLIDPLADHLDLTPFWDSLNGRSQPIVFHAAEQDLELMYRAAGALPRNIHDTQIAAALLGLGEQIGYARLVQHLMAEDLDKSQSRTDWSTRPLTEAQCQYAADDVRFLRLIYPDLMNRLAERGRQHWLAEECAGLNDSRRFLPEDDRQWRRVRGQQRLSAQQLSLLQAIAAWREQTARARNLPRRWVLSDDYAIELAIKPPENQQALLARRHWPKQRTPAEAAELIDRLDAARQLPADQWPQPVRFTRQDPETAGLLVLLQETVQQVAQEIELVPSLLATTDDLLTLIRTPDREQRLTSGWRAGIIGNRLRALLPN